MKFLKQLLLVLFGSQPEKRQAIYVGRLSDNERVRQYRMLLNNPVLNRKRTQMLDALENEGIPWWMRLLRLLVDLWLLLKGLFHKPSATVVNLDDYRQ